MRGSRFVAMLSVVALALAACGGDDDDSGASGSATGIEENAGDDDADDSGDDSGDDAGTIDDDDLDAFEALTSEDCAEALAAMAAAASAAPQALGGRGDDSLETSLAELEAFADAAPEEIRDDFRTYYETLARVAAALDESGFDPESGEMPDADSLAALEVLSKEFDDEDFIAASERLSEWFDQECATD